MNARLNDPDFWARHFAEAEDVLAIDPPAPYVTGPVLGNTRGGVSDLRLRCFWLDDRREWLVEFRKVHYVGAGPMWLYRLYELDIISRYRMLEQKPVVELYWKRHNDWLNVPWARDLVRQAIMLEALK